METLIWHRFSAFLFAIICVNAGTKKKSMYLSFHPFYFHCTSVIPIEYQIKYSPGKWLLKLFVFFSTSINLVYAGDDQKILNFLFFEHQFSFPQNGNKDIVYCVRLLWILLWSSVESTLHSVWHIMNIKHTLGILLFFLKVMHGAPSLPPDPILFECVVIY